MTSERLAPVIDLASRTRLTVHPTAPTHRGRAGAALPQPDAAQPAGSLVRVAEMALRAQRVLHDGVTPEQTDWWSTQRDTFLTAMLLVTWPTASIADIRRAVVALADALDSFRIRTPDDLVFAAQDRLP